MSEFQQFQHGQRSVFAREGDDRALDAAQRSRLAEIRAVLATPEGVHDALRERTARLLLLAEWGEEWLREVAERDGGAKAFEARMLQRFVSVIESARRHLELLIRLQGKGDGGPGAGDVLDAMRGKRDEQG